MDEKPDLVDYYLEKSTDVEICKMADLGDPSADYIFYEVWDEAKRKEVTAQVDKQWKDQWD